MEDVGVAQWVHQATLHQDIRRESAARNPWKAPPDTWRGEDFDALELLQ